MLSTRVALGFLLATGLLIGTWATLFPADWYASFPGLGHRWVSVDGPFNLHLIHDVGSAYLMIAALAVICLLRPDQVSPMAAGITTLCFNAPHLAYHATHLSMYPPVDGGLSLAALTLAVLCSLWLAAARAPVLA